MRTDDTIGRRLRAARLRRRLPLREVAAKAVIVNVGRGRMRCLWAITPPTF
jgi:hypothetical protein